MMAAVRADGLLARAIATAAVRLVRPCALRAPTAFSVRIKDIRTENVVMFKNKDDLRLSFIRDRNSATTGGAIWVATYSFLAQPLSVSRICLCSLTGSARILRIRILSISTATEKAIAK